MANRRLLWIGIAACTALAVTLAVILAAYRNESGIQVTVANGGGLPLRDLVVRVTGRSYSVGDVPPGESRSVRVNPTSESHAEIEFTDEQGRRVRLAAGAYFEPAYRGRLDIRVRDGRIEDVQYQDQPSAY
jgi:hypothetical protein